MAKLLFDLMSGKKFLFTGLANTGIPEAPTDSTVYGRLNGTWSPIQLPKKLLSEIKTVGVGGDFLNINAGLSYADGYTWSMGTTLELRILTGTVITEQIRLINKNFGFVKITSVDPEVLINPTTWTISD
jgi:hypothetical protein